MMNDYDKELLNREVQNIRFKAETKKIDLLTKIESNSNILIKNIKNKIELLEKYELFSLNIDKINEINDEVQNIFSENIGNKIIKYISNIKPDILEESSEIIKNNQILFNISKNIKSEINNEINEMNRYIENYVSQYKEENIYNLNLNLYYISKSFSDESINNLIQNDFYLIRDTIDKHLKNIIDYNYKLEKKYCRQVILEVLLLRGILFTFITKRIAITKGTIERVEKFIDKNLNLMTLILGEDLREIFINNFYSLKEEILSFVNKKLLSIKKYYLNEGDYSYYFNFISKGINEIKNKIDYINNYFNDEYFEENIEKYYLEKLSGLANYESKLENSLLSLFNDLQNVAIGITEYHHSKDYCIQQHLIFFFWIFIAWKWRVMIILIKLLII